ADVTATEPSSSDSRVERPEPYGSVEDALLAGDTPYISQPLTPEKEDALQAATVANLRAALLSKNSLLSLKADVLGEDSSLLFEYLPKGTHSLSRPGTNSNPSRGECDGKVEAPWSPPLPAAPIASQSPPRSCSAGEMSPETAAKGDVPTSTQAAYDGFLALWQLDNSGSDTSFSPSEDADVAADGLFLDSAPAKRATCGFCRRVFQRAEELKEHVHTHAFSMLFPLDSADCPPPALAAPAQLPRFQCSKCPASFTLKSNMDRHQKTVHFHCKKMRCPNCAKLFRDKTDLNRHLMSVRSSQPTLGCLLCGKGFGTQKNLANHIRVCYLGGFGLWGSVGPNEEPQDA
ncbi:PREDICTED: transcription factor hamlet-like, partial [Mesitornis unicolor]|uniref:transcription factor hamlet-like n=1 Tax=Mesitornis unicolor TaxID=54374 RepID=UPI000529575A